MPLDPHRLDRTRRTEAVIEILRRRAAQRDARGQEVPPALRAAIADFDEHLGRGVPRLGRSPQGEPR
jgi:hypothetical protein